MSKKKKEVKIKNEDVLLGLDYGESNIGVAFGRSGVVCPIKVIEGRNQLSAIHEIIRLAMENKAVKIILGLPLTSEGRETKQSLSVRQFAKLLRVLSKKPVEFHDEHSSTQTALEEAIDLGIPQKGRRMTDHLSAAVILKRYYSEHPASS